MPQNGDRKLDQSQRYIGLISGTSMDAIDAVIIETSSSFPRPKLIHALNYPFPENIRQAILPLLHEPECMPFGHIVQAELQLADTFAAAVKTLLEQAKLSAQQITAIGCHGQTLCHRPNATPPYTVQLGDNARLSVLTGIDVVGDFRRADVADHGQGAPLASLLHQAMFSSSNQRNGVINIGGIGNLTVLPAISHFAQTTPVLGFDTGPGNGLMDQWHLQHQGGNYDPNGQWAAQGKVIPQLLETLLQDKYFQRPPPKSTGREAFNLVWLNQLCPDLKRWPAEDVQATLLELTARTITDACKQQQCHQLYVCGGGAQNGHLMQRLQALLPNGKVSITSELGLDPNWVEAVLFAWLAWRYQHQTASNLPSITGSQQARILGARWYAA